jgi:hypothetical protein
MRFSACAPEPSNNSEINELGTTAPPNSRALRPSLYGARRTASSPEPQVASGSSKSLSLLDLFTCGISYYLRK